LISSKSKGDYFLTQPDHIGNFMIIDKSILFGSALLVVGILIAFYGFNLLRRCEESKNWPKVVGRIVKYEIVGFKNGNVSGRTHSVRVKYEYCVGESSYTSKRYALWGSEYTNKQDAENATKDMCVGAQADVFYCPSDPRLSVLVTGPRATKKFSEIAWGLLFVIFGLFIIFG
jgi:hypothetical protein